MWLANYVSLTLAFTFTLTLVSVNPIPPCGQGTINLVHLHNVASCVHSRHF